MEKGKNTASDYHNRTFPGRLQKLIRTRKVTQKELADYCGVKRQSIGQWKDGRNKPDIVSLRRIAEFFNVSADYLLGISDVTDTSVTVRYMVEITGLSEKNLDWMIKSRNYSLPTADLINDLLDILFRESRPEDSGSDNPLVSYFMLTRGLGNSSACESPIRALEEIHACLDRLSAYSAFTMPREDYIRFYAGQLAESIREGLIHKYDSEKEKQLYGKY